MELFKQTFTIGISLTITGLACYGIIDLFCTIMAKLKNWEG
ncbi:hypothetical protein G166_gp40 [Clostridium phage phi8074-B1]|nr:hypothetical protein G166_gp40 [Clostridium phage phi8074-B1]AFC61972.1 hypothetical protein phi8074-B1_00040 [Clostridium phage phi8074-B1]